MKLEDFNRRVAIGDTVKYFPDTCDVAYMTARTRGKAFVLRKGLVAVWLSGVRQPVPLNHIKLFDAAPAPAAPTTRRPDAAVAP